ncbi:Putative phosphatidate cytidylyltransferase [Leucoagaricus sp. SymC.cos]|nr:Putative phosphatidate cytidylyltransferase [Leucoagaricus sp. SymC.cos]
MSRQTDPRNLFATQTAFSALHVESGEESEEEVQVEQLTDVPPVEVKPSKSALKKAARQARLEKKQQQRADARKRRTEEQQRSLTSSPVPEKESTSNGSAAAHSLSSATTLPEIVPKAEPEVPAEPKPDSAVEPTAAVAPQASEPETSVPPQSLVHSLKDVKKALARSQPVSQPEPEAETPKASITKSTGQVAAEAEKEKKRRNVFERTIWTLIMIGGFIGLLLLGHVYMILLVMLCQTLVYREVTALFSLATTESETQGKGSVKTRDPWSKTLNWYFFAVTNYFLYGESIIYYFKHVVFADAQLVPFVTNHRMISFTLYVIGFMGFVMSLKKGALKQQFGLFCWVHMTLLMIVVSSHFIVNNILEGLIWFWVPASLVICNDVFAYIWGITLGRTPLIKLSPKKTVEGFVGAFFSTLIFALFWGSFFMRFNYMTCPVHDLGVSAWSSVQCKPNPVFVWQRMPLWRPLALFLTIVFNRPIPAIWYTPYHFHLLLMACFASLVAPFGGFFASGFKRAFNIKDFGHSIPGHGGMTDRMDCQFLMGVFTYVYYSSLIREHHVTVGSILQTIVSGLTVEEQLELIADLRRYLGKQGITVS